MGAIILTKEDAKEVEYGIVGHYTRDEQAPLLTLLRNGSEGLSWLSVVPDETLKAIADHSSLDGLGTSTLAKRRGY